jgi:hypothetical protein
MTTMTHGVRDLHEEATCVRFLAAYNAVHSTSITFQALQDPPHPDCSCTGDLEIELVSAYYDPAAAKERLDLARGKVKAPTPIRSIEEPDQTIYEQIDAAITNKAGKHYEVKSKPWLVVRVDAPLLEWQDLAADYLDEARGLPSGEFDEVWVLLGDSDGDHVARVLL